MISSTQIARDMQKQNRLMPTRLPLQMEQQDHQHQLIKNQSNMPIIKNNTLLTSSASTNNLSYLQQPPIICQNLSSSNHQTQQQGLLASMSNTQMPTLGSTSNAILNTRMGRLYSTGSSNSVPHLSNAANEFIDNGLSNMQNLPNTILINNFTTQQIQPESIQSPSSRHLYEQQLHCFHSTQQQQQSFPSCLQIQHNSSATHQSQLPLQLPHQHQHQLQNQQHPYQNSQGHILQQNQYFSSPHVESTESSTTSQTMQLHLPTTQSFYVSAEAFGTGANDSKMSSGYISTTNVNSSLPTNLNEIHTQQKTPVTSNNSPVVLDRINICINNHYSDSGLLPATITNSNGASSIMMSSDDNPPLPSPIIPPIQHSGAIDPALLMDTLAYNSDINPSSPVPPVISEPDSTTTSNTPPTTPENPNQTLSGCTHTVQSPSTSSTGSGSGCGSDPLEQKEHISNKIKIVESESSKVVSKTPIECDQIQSSSLPKNEIPSAMSLPEILYTIGEDVFVRKEDDRLYLGTIIDSRYQKYRIRFDDKSEVWCSSREMRKFGNFGSRDASTSAGGEISKDDTELGILCVSCKTRDHSGAVDICERCGRGYHHKCTTETILGSGEWLCKRCNKPMKLGPCEKSDHQKYSISKIQLPYDINSLTWDAKHRVNQEKIYCYCGKSGQFDHNMLQCCKCLNWFHTACLEDFKEPMLRGDGNFLFCCSICSNDGKEFLRRLGINTVDFVHLVLYHLSAQRKHQQHKYHHLTKDICPFVLAQRHRIALPEEWCDMSEDDLKDCILTTLKNNPNRFICGREVKRDGYYYGLRNKGPPMRPKTNIDKGVDLNDHFITEYLRLKISNRNIKDLKTEHSTTARDDKKSFSKEEKHNVYEEELHSRKEDIDEDEEKFTSDDEIPIKHILEKEKELNIQGNEMNLQPIAFNTAQNEIEKDCQVNRNMEKDREFEKSSEQLKLIKVNEKRSHKRKAFTLSKPYKETAAEAASKRYHSVRGNCDSSSDDNSSSSRGTSLDLIIPPPKDFLGLNNPFRIVTPKKNSDKKASILQHQHQHLRCNHPGGPAIKNSIVNTSSLDFSTKLAALKSAGIFPNLNTTSLAKAAGQPRMVRTIKRRLSAKDIMIGPNQEVRRRRTRRLSANIEVISTTTINPLPGNIFSLNAKDLFTPGVVNINAPIRKQNILNSLNSMASLSTQAPTQSQSQSQQTQSLSNSSSSSLLFKEQFSLSNKIEKPPLSSTKLPVHGRRLRARIQKKPVTTASSRRNSLSGASTSSTSSSSCTAAIPSVPTVPYPEPPSLNDLQQSVNKYFGVGNRITANAKFSVHAKRQLPNGQVQYLLEWGNENGTTEKADYTINVEPEDHSNVE